MATYSSWAALKKAVVSEQVLAVELQDLKELHGVKRLGSNVLAEIADRLHSDHLTYFPAKMLEWNDAPRQTQIVWLTPASDTNVLHKVVQAVQEPDPERVDVLRSLLEGDSGWAEVEQLKARLANVRAALEDAMESVAEED